MERDGNRDRETRIWSQYSEMVPLKKKNPKKTKKKKTKLFS